MKVYVITCGKHSDYRICAVALDEKKAEKLKKKFDYADCDEARIEEYDTDECQIILEKNRDMYEVFFRRNGRCSRIINKTLETFTLRRRFHTDDETEEYIHYVEDNGCCYVHVFADGVESAVKIAAERRAKYLAQKNGL